MKPAPTRQLRPNPIDPLRYCDRLCSICELRRAMVVLAGGVTVCVACSRDDADAV